MVKTYPNKLFCMHSVTIFIVKIWRQHCLCYFHEDLNFRLHSGIQELPKKNEILFIRAEKRKQIE